MTSKSQKITVSVIDRLKPGAIVWDTRISGFGVRLQTRAPTYFLKTRVHGRQRWFTIGRHGSPWTPETARREARSILGDVAKGKDPTVSRDEAIRDITVAQLCELYLEQGCANKKPSTLATDKGRINRHIKPLLGRRRVATLTQADVEQFLHDIASGKTATDVRTGPRGRAIVTGGKGTATRTVGLLGGILSFAVERGIRPDNPVRHARRFKDRQRDRMLSSEEIWRLIRMLSGPEAGNIHPYAIAQIRLLLLTGARKSEILTLRWSNVDFEKRMITLDDSKTGPKKIPLSQYAIDVFQGLPRLGRTSFVFPAFSGGGYYQGLPKVWRQIRSACGLDDVRLHDLRHTYASVAASQGVGLYLIGTLLGHRQAQSTQRYAHIGDELLHDLTTNVGQQIMGDFHLETTFKPNARSRSNQRRASR